MEGKLLLAGAAKVDITPKMGTQIAGVFGSRRPAEVLIDPLFAKALVLDDGERKLCVLPLDLCVIVGEWGDTIRNGAAERFGLDPDAVMVHLMQNHAAPSLGGTPFSFESEHLPPEFPWLKGSDDEYHPVAVERTLQAIGMALEKMQPVRMGIATGVEARVAFNRRFACATAARRTGLAAVQPRTWPTARAPSTRNSALSVLRPSRFDPLRFCSTIPATRRTDWSVGSPPTGPARGRVAFGLCTAMSACPRSSTVAAPIFATATF